jgi:hypothetical protein
MESRDMCIAAERMKNQDGVGAFGVEFAPSLVGDSVGRKRPSAIEREGILGRVEGMEKCALRGQAPKGYKSCGLLEYGNHDG